jgi:hypothetical protein
VPWIFLFVVTCLAYILEVLLVQADGRVVTVHIIQPYLVVMDDQARLLVTQLTDPAVDGQPLVDVCLPGSAPGLTLVELFLVQTAHVLAGDPVRPPLRRMLCRPCNTVAHSQALDLCRHIKKPVHLCPAFHAITISFFGVPFYAMILSGHFCPKSSDFSGCNKCNKKNEVCIEYSCICRYIRAIYLYIPPYFNNLYFLCCFVAVYKYR